MLNALSTKFDKENIELYRDDGIYLYKNHNDHQSGKVWREMIDLFK